MSLEVEPTTNFDWANDAFAALNDPILQSTADKWPAFSHPQEASFGIPPSLLTQSTIERYGQVTPPEELSPADQGDSFRQQSPPVETLRNEVSWPVAAQVQALANYQPSPAQVPAPPEEQTPESLSPKRRRTTRALSTNQHQASLHPAEDVPVTNPQPLKRKRGRPKSQPQPPLEAYSQDGFPFQVSSARQTHLEKNRVAAHKCRQRKKEYINSLETRAREYSSRNKQLKENVAMLREEVLELKNEVLRHAGCGFWAVDEYLARCAGDLLGVDSSGRESSRGGSTLISRRNSSKTHSPTLSTLGTQQERIEIMSDRKADRRDSQDSLPSQGTTGTPEDWSDLEILKDIDEME